MEPTYENTISEINRVARSIRVDRTEGDGRIDSATSETPFLELLMKKLLETNPVWVIVIPPARAFCDIIINNVQINLKLTDCKSSDNSCNKRAVYYSITGSLDYPYSSSWNDFFARLKSADKKKVRDVATEYHYLVKNKITGDVLLKPMFDIHTYVPNASNDLQINWKNEFAHADYRLADSDYEQKVVSLLQCIQTSVRQMIERTRDFAYADMGALMAE